MDILGDLPAQLSNHVSDLLSLNFTPEAILVAIGGLFVLFVLWRYIMVSRALKRAHLADRERSLGRVHENGDARNEDAKGGRGGFNPWRSGWLFGGGVLAAAVLVANYFSLIQVKLTETITNNNWLPAVIIVVVTFLVVQRFQEMAEWGKTSRTRMDELTKLYVELTDKINDVSKDFDERHSKGLNEKIETIYNRLAEFVHENQWVKAVLDENLDRAYPNLNSLNDAVVEKTVEGRLVEGYELYKRMFAPRRNQPHHDDAQAVPSAPYATTTDVEQAAFILFYIIGDRKMAYTIHTRYSSDLSADPRFVLSAIRYAYLANQVDAAHQWILYIQERRRRTEITKLLANFYLVSRERKLLATRDSYLLEHWSTRVALAYYQFYTGGIEKAEQLVREASLARKNYQDEMTFTTALAQIEYVKQSESAALEVLDARFKERSPSALQAYLYLHLYKKHAMEWDDDRIELVLDTAEVRDDLDKDIHTLARQLVKRGETDEDDADLPDDDDEETLGFRASHDDEDVSHKKRRSNGIAADSDDELQSLFEEGSVGSSGRKDRDD
ncbi:MAG: hypothetical protein RLZ98_2123 [Pseudomonadota bacterium]|jgi:hypothetical protein